jgi:hypothetical protein
MQGPLLRAVLTGGFRADRHARMLLVERLPEEPPVAAADEKVRAVWGRIVQAQARFLAEGVASPWAFAELVRDLHGCLQEATVLSAHDRADVVFALSVGPGYEGHPYDGTGRVYDDASLRRHWVEWAAEAGCDGRQWGKTDYAYWRFHRRLSLRRSLEACDRETDAEEARWERELAERAARE